MIGSSYGCRQTKLIKIMLSQLLISAILTASPIKHTDIFLDIPKQDAIVRIEESRRLNRRERRASKRRK